MFAEEELAAREHPPTMGCAFTVRAGRFAGSGLVELASSASWEVEEIGVRQEGHCHAGFRGTLAALLGKVKTDVDRMRGAYPAAMQAKIDAFMEAVDRDGEITLRVRDPSGLSRADAEGAEQSWFERSFFEAEELGLLQEQQEQPADVAALVRGAKRVVCLTGAGISVESGVPPFRNSSSSSSSDGDAFWGAFDAGQMTLQKFNSGEACAGWWRMKRALMAKVRGAEPNPAHTFWGLLSRRGQLGQVITQNIDSLHLAGGAPPEKVLELHGHLRGVVCSAHKTALNPVPSGAGGCDFRLSAEGVEAAGLFSGSADAVPSCPACSAPLRTETVMFGQPLPEGALERASEEIART